ncbi:MAG TPA: NUDIX hydrolase [Actinomycetota bacterium]
MTAARRPPFEVLDRSRPFHGHVVTVRVDRIASPDGRSGTREVVEHPGAVAALAVDQQGAVLLVDQWRHAIGGRLVEISAGKYDVTGERVEDALRRELAEELRVEGGTLTWLTTFYTTPGWSDEVVDLYLAEGVRPIDGEGPEADWEEAGMEVVRLDYEEALRLVTTRTPGDSKTLVGLTLYGLLREGKWAPDPSGRPAPDAPARRAAQRPPAGETVSGQRPPKP